MIFFETDLMQWLFSDSCLRSLNYKTPYNAYPKYNMMDKLFIATMFHRIVLAQNQDWEKLCSIFLFYLKHALGYGRLTEILPEHTVPLLMDLVNKTYARRPPVLTANCASCSTKRWEKEASLCHHVTIRFGFSRKKKKWWRKGKSISKEVWITAVSGTLCELWKKTKPELCGTNTAESIFKKTVSFSPFYSNLKDYRHPIYIGNNCIVKHDHSN